MITRRFQSIRALLALAATAGCGGTATTMSDMAVAASDFAMVDAGPAPKQPVSLSVRVRNPNGRNIYLGAYPDVPSGMIDTTKMIEFVNVDITYHDGYAYVWDRDSSVMTRYSIDANLKLTAGPTVSFKNLGVTGQQNQTIVSSTWAISEVPLNPKWVIWNPTTMEIIGTINADNLQDKDYVAMFYGDGVVFGDYAAIPLAWYNAPKFLIKPMAAVALVKTGSLDPPLLITDTRGSGNSNIWVDEAGDLYVPTTNQGGLHELFSKNPVKPPPSTVLRIKKGTTTFDSTYAVNLLEAGKTTAIHSVYPLQHHKLLIAGLDPMAVVTADNYQTSFPKFLPIIVDLDAKSSVAAPGVAPAQMMANTPRIMDGEVYFNSYTLVTGTTAVNIYRVNEAGGQLVFNTLGDLWSIGHMTVH